MSRRNKPLAAQQPAPAFANDPYGYWAAVSTQNATTGISSLLNAGTVIQSDVAIKGRLLASQIEWTPCRARWNGCNVSASLSDPQFLLSLETGGDTQQGNLILIVAKLQFSGFAKGMPTYGDTFEIQAGAVWHQFVISGMTGQHDDNEPALTLALEKDQNEIGD